ncbi:hypothetical protein [Burkholderia lata]|uniref:Uncharacterized protein n=1 Tax=Burkholderia lata (strain ATCC 17760 / DSM 23089 / LMG 22485 / NCIMB 9086 / R18194 / 383) TaxID=482957 RepID=A0A6P2TE90_BURL3|nr:hypothetical protein [Burkholderia lata]VWC54006.1 hypothetical protein BLA18109_00572 [Burkholderia lata]
MARHQVKSFKVSIGRSGESVRVEIETEIKKPYKFELTPDVHYPTVQDVEGKLKAALTHCVDTYEKIDISVFKDRSYVSINVKDFIDTRFSGKAV